MNAFMASTGGRAPPAAPISAASPPCSRSSPRSSRSLPIVSHDRPRAPAPSALLARAPQAHTEPMISASPSLHPLKDQSLRETRYGSDRILDGLFGEAIFQLEC